MKNMDTWKFAHDYCGRLWWKIGWIMIILTTLLQLPFPRSNENVICMIGLTLCSIQVIVLIAAIFPTEAALKKTFFEDGIRKSSNSPDL